MAACAGVNSHRRGFKVDIKMQASIPTSHPDEAPAIRADQVRTLYGGAIAPMIANVLVTLILAAIEWRVISSSAIIIWLIIQACIISIRILFFISYRRIVSLNRNIDDKIWLRRFRGTTAAGGVGWAMSCLLMFPANDIPHQAFMSLAFAGLTAGVITAMSIDLVSILLFSIPLMATLGVRLFIEGGEISIAMGLMVMLYLILTSIIARRTNLSFRENVILRLTGVSREESLRRSETKFRTLYNSTGDAVMLLTEKGFIDCNEATLHMFGCKTTEEFCGKHPSDLSPAGQPDGSDSMTLANERIAAALSQGNQRFEWTHRRADTGVTFTAEVLLSAMTLDGKNVVQAVIRDITERKWMENLLRKREREFRSLAENSPDNIIRYDRECRAVYANRTVEKTIPVTGESITGKKPLENQFNGMTGLEDYQARLELVLATGEPGHVEITLLNSVGELRTHHVFFVAEHDDNGEITGALAFGRDITDLKQQEALEEVRLHVFEKMAENSELSEILKLIILYTEKFRPGFLVSIMLVSSNAKQLEFISAPSLPDEYNQAVNGLEIGDGIGSCGTSAWSGKTVIVEDIRNHAFWKNYKELALRYGFLSCWSEPIFSSIGKTIGTFAIYGRTPCVPNESDLKLMREAGYLAAMAIERKQSEETIHNLAFFDPLTGLPNRRLLQDRIQHTLATSERNKRYGAILFIDLDKFKELNDTKGHDIGDLLLIECASRLQSCLRAGDTVSRLGGDEFVIVLNDLSPDKEYAAVQAEIIAEKMREAINQPFVLKNYEYQGSPSIGISLFLGNEFSGDELLKRADTAMYQAKRSGRNTCRFFDPTNHAAMEVRIVLENDLRVALSKNQFKLYYQMQVNHKSRIIGAEALLRWQHPEKGMIPPSVFIPITEETGLIIDIGYWALETACKQLKAWESGENTKHLQLSVNISARQFRQTDFVEQVEGILKKTGVNPGKIKLELTESLLLGSVAEIIVRMQALKNIGIFFSMDDFGTGYSSLSYLSQLPLDQLKIDKSFVQKIFINPADAVIVQTIIGLGKILLLDVIAEGVETVEQRDFLLDNACLSYQGYLFGIPIPINEFEKILV
jgi:diguanylate cyclase (GGDEF)-like protein/PAS domain S-box-containing protein